MKRKLSLLAAVFLVIRIAGAANVGVGLPGDNVTVNTHVKIGTSTDPGELTLTGPTGAGATLPTLQASGDGGFYFPAGSAAIEPAVTMVSGMYFYPAKAALRVGSFYNAISFASVGANSVAIGTAIASGQGAMGVGYSTASGVWSLAAGYSYTSGAMSFSAGSGSAIGASAVCLGSGLAGGLGSLAVGGTASGDNSVAFGATTAQAAYSVAIGKFNTLEGDPLTWRPEDPLFVIGNGTGPAANQKSNALVVYKNGKIKMQPQGDISMGEFAP